MNKSIIKKIAVWLLSASGLLPLALRAQDQTVTGNLTVDQAFIAGASSSSANLLFCTNGATLLTGSYNDSGGGLPSSAASLTGPAFLWYPTKAAFWGGYLDTVSLSDANVGAYSVALGYDNVAASTAGIALGSNNSTSGSWGEVAMGNGNSSVGTGAVAVGYDNTSGNATNGSYGTIALGVNSYVAGIQSIGLGLNSYVVGNYSVGIESSSVGSDYSVGLGFSYMNGGPYCVAIGYGAEANSNLGESIGIGYQAKAEGWGYTTAIGNNLNDSCYQSTALGCFNVGAGSLYGWTPTDPLFELGDGGDGAGNGNPAATGPSDAFVVYKNGNASFQGSVTATAGGDIPMFTGN